MTPDAPRAEPQAADLAPAAADAVTTRLRTATLATTAAMVLLGLAWELWLAPTGRGTWAVKVVPLALCFLGLMRHRMVTYRWLSLLVWLYFTEGLTRAITESGVSMALAWGQTVLSVALFALAATYIRWRLRRGRELQVAREAAAAR
jgi:uncharacterized membrane protein